MQLKFYSHVTYYVVKRIQKRKLTPTNGSELLHSEQKLDLSRAATSALY